jgi:CrcB protein
MLSYLLVFLGAGLGGALRHALNLACARALGTSFPWGTVVINVTGSLCMGLIAGFFAFKAGVGWSQHTRLFLTTGILGGYTTFSTFSLEVVLLWERGEMGLAALYVFGSVGLGVAGLMSGLWLIRSLA